MDPKETTIIMAKPLSKEIHLCKAQQYSVKAERYRVLAHEEPNKKEKFSIKVEKYRKKSEENALQASLLTKDEEKLAHNDPAAADNGFLTKVKHVLGKKEYSDSRKERREEKLMGKELKRQHLKIAEEQIKLAKEERKHGLVHEKIIEYHSSATNVPLARSSSDKDKNPQKRFRSQHWNRS